MRLMLTALTLAFSSVGWAKTEQVSSPSGNIVFSISDDQSVPQYSVVFNGKRVIEPSGLGLVFNAQAPFTEGFKIESVTSQTADTTWEQPWGERREVRDQHNELLVEFKHPGLPNAEQDTSWWQSIFGGEQELISPNFRVRVRVFDDGLGFRYEVPNQKGYESVEIVKENTEFAISGADKTTAYWIPARGWNRYEYTYETTPLFDAAHVHTPFTVVNQDKVHISLHEAALVDYAAMTLNQRRHGRFVADLTPWYDGIAVKTETAFQSPWRTIQIADEAVGLLNSDLILNLNEPNKLGDVSWVKPGKYVGIWWEMHINKSTWGSGDKHGATTENTKTFMDFASEYGFDGVLVEGWNIGWDGDWFFNGDVFSFTENYDDFDIVEVARYGKEKGVTLIGHHETSGNVTNYRNQMAAALDLYESLGVEQIKTGYVADGGNIKRVEANGVVRKEWHDGQFMVNEYLDNIKEAAKRKISINTHEPIKDTGLRRTYPNWLAREGARGQEFNAWGSPPNPPEHLPMLAFTRMLSGPMDFTPGIFDMGFNGLGDKTNRPQTTLAKQLASYVVLYSPIQMAADLPENYLAKRDAFQFIVDVPTDWEQSIALAGEVGDYVVFARKERQTQRYLGNDWYLGGLTDEKARSVTVALSFLDEGKEFEAQIYRDGDNAEWKNNPYDYVIETQKVTNKDKLTLNMAPSGGVAIRFKAL